MENYKNLKGLILVAVVAVISYLIYRFVFKGVPSNMIEGYSKNAGEFIACGVENYNDKFYSGNNSAGVKIYFKKKDVRETNRNNKTKCVDAAKDTKVYTLKS